jgi:hypothetical protein
MSTAKQRIAIVGSAMLLLSGCANQGGGQVRSGTSISGYASENNLGTPRITNACKRTETLRKL